MYSSHCFFRASGQMKQLLVISHKDGIPRQPKLSAMPVTSLSQSRRDADPSPVALHRDRGSTGPGAPTKPRAAAPAAAGPPRPAAGSCCRPRSLLPSLCSLLPSPLAGPGNKRGQCGGARPLRRGGSAHAPAGPARPGTALAPAGPGALSPGPGAAARSGRRRRAQGGGIALPAPDTAGGRRLLANPAAPRLGCRPYAIGSGRKPRGATQIAGPERRRPSPAAAAPPPALPPPPRRGRSGAAPAARPPLARPGPAAPPRCAPRAPHCPARAWRFLPAGLHPSGLAAAGAPRRRLLQHPGLAGKRRQRGTLHPCPDLRLSSTAEWKSADFQFKYWTHR
ncbi:uncharacterized protein LOC113459594 [Zonotrichia albicollis]|uniref:uncharacterized protein LOC113459594 n=1 Tax=Zonotrichia albicollis TaxID=44394 RepID=UPI003D80E768